MADKHILALELLREYRVDLTVPHEVELTFVSDEPIDELVVSQFALSNGFGYLVEKADDLYIATLTKTIMITEQTVRPLSEFVENFALRNGWDYDGWGASSWK